MTNILTFTDKASNQLEKIIQSAPSDTVGILLGVDKTGCNGHSYKLDFAKKNEVENLEYVERNNIKVFIDPKATMFLIGSEMDYLSDKLASRFVFTNPNEKSTCGCGESFSI
ncbi:iron-sulfur cluster assembly accessory protein [Alphaproteobacteria bacterium]|nr:iron-sulfur cluster assembly accessory protein [Alphaproteobacteria bacterium]